MATPGGGWTVGQVPDETVSLHMPSAAAERDALPDDQRRGLVGKLSGIDNGPTPDRSIPPAGQPMNAA